MVVSADKDIDVFDKATLTVERKRRLNDRDVGQKKVYGSESARRLLAVLGH